MGNKKIREKIDKMLDQIEASGLLDRVYRFIKYIYIHKT